MRVTGTVSEIKEYPSAKGTIYSIVVNGQSYGTYITKPQCGRGDTVSFDYTEKGNFKNVNMKTLSVEAGPPTASTGGSVGSYTDKQVVISRQSALNSAIAFVSVVVDADAVPGVTKTTKPEDRYAIIEALVNEKAEEFHNASTAGEAPSPVQIVDDKAASDKPWT